MVKSLLFVRRRSLRWRRYWDCTI